jgi:ribA/ribD-fused uncharacterized protein
MGRTHAAAAASKQEAKATRHTVKFFRESGPYGYFSNFWKHKKPLRYKGKTFATAEHAYQYEKFAYDGAPAANTELAESVREQNTPAMAAFLARGNGGGIRWKWGQKLRQLYLSLREKGATIDPKWDDRRVDVMRDVVKLKVEQDADFAAKLKATGDAQIEEASPYDSFWGTGKKGDGENWLGKVLMETRAAL